MQYFQHEFADVKHYLHHRPPYLLIDSIESIAADRIVTHASVDRQQLFVEGHFPGAPILPGAMMQEMTSQTAGILIAARFNPMPEFNTEDPFFNEYALGVLVSIKNARYRGFARPGDKLTVTAELQSHLDDYFEFTASIRVGENRIMQNCFRLANIPSKTLQGVS